MQRERERERLNREREEIFDQQKNLQDKLTEINRKLTAIDAYEAAKTGKAATPTRRPRAPRKSATTTQQLSAELLVHPQPQTGTRGERPCYKSSGEIRTVLAKAKSSNVRAAKETNPRRSQCPMPSQRSPRATRSPGETGKRDRRMTPMRRGA